MNRALQLAVREMDQPLLEYNYECRGWALNTYLRCDHCCKYCITGVQGASSPRYRKDVVVEQLRRELVQVPIDEPLGIGGFCDAYPHAEEHFGVTREVVAELVRQERPFRITTKGMTVWRDADLLMDYPKGQVGVSLCSVDEWAVSQIDANAPSVLERLRLIALLHCAGVRVVVSAAPWIPEVSDARAIIHAVPMGIPIFFAALNVVNDPIAKSPFAKHFRQAEINEAYREEAARIGNRKNVVFFHPVPVDGWGKYCAFSPLGGELVAH